jgi:outer membrane protein
MQTIIRTTVAALVLALFAGFVVPAQAQSIKIGVFDPGRVSEEAEDAKLIQQELLTIRDKKQTEIAAREQAINELRQKLNQQALSLSSDKRTTMEIDIQRKMLEFNSLKEMASQELQLEFSAAEARFNDKLRRVVEQFARDQGFALVLDVSVVAWASNTIDVTTPIVDLYNRMYPVEAAAPDSAE